MAELAAFLICAIPGGLVTWWLARVSQMPFPYELAPARRAVRPPARLFEDHEVTAADDLTGLV